VHEVAVGERACTARLAECAELCVQRADCACVLRAKLFPGGSVVPRVAGEDRRDAGIFHLERVARHDARPRAARVPDGGERDHVVLHDRVRAELGEDLAQPVVGVAGAVAERAEGGLDELGELLDRRLAEDRRGLADEVLPELTRRLLGLGRRAEAHEALLEALCLEAAGEGLLDDEHDAVTALAQHAPDADAVVRRAVGAFREEDDRAHDGSDRRDLLVACDDHALDLDPVGEDDNVGG